MHYFKIVSIVLLSAMFYGCDKYDAFKFKEYSHKIECEQTRDGSLNPRSTGILGKWQYKGYYLNGSFQEVSYKKAKLPGLFEVKFSANNHFNLGNTAFAGDYILYSPKTIKINNMAIPLLPLSKEAEMFINYFQNAKCFKLTNKDQLFIKANVPDKNNDVTMRFTRID